MIKSFFKDGMIYFLPNILSRGVVFLLLPIYTRYLSPSEYGLLDLLAAMYAILAIVLPLEISQGVSRLINEEPDKPNKSTLVSTAFWFTFIMFSIFGVFANIAPEIIAMVLEGSLNHVDAIRVAGISMPLNALFYAVQNQLRWSLAAKANAITSLIFVIISSSTSVCLLVFFDAGINAMLLGQAAGAFFGLCSGIIMAKNYVPLGITFNFNKFKSLITYSLPLAFSSSAYVGATFIDRWMLKAFLTLDDVGIYAIALKLSSMVSIIIYASQMSLSPLIYSQYKLPETPQAINSLLRYYLLFTMSLAMTLGFISEPLIAIMTGPNFSAASELLVILPMAIVLSSIYVYFPGLNLAKKTKLIALINFLFLTCNVILNLILIPAMGIMGAAISTLIGSMLFILLYWFLGKRYYDIPVSLLTYFRAGLFVVTFSIFSYFIPFSYTLFMVYLLCLIGLCSALTTRYEIDKIRAFFISNNR